jgi:flagellar export protein FliJ
MKKYRFRLEQVLRVRRLEEERARAAVLVARREADVSAGRVRDRIAAYHSFEPAAGPVASARLLADRALHTLRADAVEVARGREAEAWKVVADRLQVWSGAAQKVAALERLDERRRADHALAARREDDLVVDDLVTVRFARQERER